MMLTPKLRQCPICEVKDFEKIYYGGIYPEKVSVSICKRCGLVCQNPRYNNTYYNKYYIGKCYGRRLTPAEAASKQVFTRNGREQQIYRHIKDFAKKSSSIFEIGFGGGSNLIFLKKKGYNHLYGNEIDISGVKALQNNGIAGFHGNLEKYFSGNKQKYDFIILSHVLEHFANPLGALHIIRNILKRNGFLYILLPNIISPENPYFEFRIDHVSYFSEKTFKNALQRSGFEIIKKYPSTKSEIDVVCRISEKKTQKKTNEYPRLMDYLQKWPKRDMSTQRFWLETLSNIVPSKIYQTLIGLVAKRKFLIHRSQR